MCSYQSPAAVDGVTSISSLHQDIIQTHILTRLDGQTLASAGCASPQLHALSSDDKLWTRICNSTWPSTNDSRVRDAISTFPSGHRSFFSDSFPSPNHHRRRPVPSQPDETTTSELISAVDLHYQNELIFSKVQVTDTAGEWFKSSPIRVDLLDPKELIPTPVKFEPDDETCQSNLEKYLALSWIVIDPTLKRSVNLSSLKPVSVKLHWLTGDVQVRYAIVIPAGQLGGVDEHVSCNVDVTCGGKGGEMHVSEVSMQVQDIDGKSLSGKDSLVIIEEVMEMERRKQGQNGDKRKRYEEYVEMKRERKEQKERRERRVDMVCIASGVTIFVAFCAFIFFR